METRYEVELEWTCRLGKRGAETLYWARKTIELPFVPVEEMELLIGPLPLMVDSVSWNVDSKGFWCVVKTPEKMYESGSKTPVTALEYIDMFREQGFEIESWRVPPDLSKKPTRAPAHAKKPGTPKAPERKAP